MTTSRSMSKNCSFCPQFKLANIKTGEIKPIVPSYVRKMWATDIATLPDS